VANEAELTQGSAKSDLVALAERLAEVVRAHGGPSVVSRNSAIPLRSLTRYISGQAEIGALALVALARTCRVSLDQLFGLGECGVVPIDAGTGATAPQLADASLSDLAMIPVLEVAAAAGAGAVNHGSEVIAQMPFSRAILRRLGVNPDRVEFIRARGDSMEPTIGNGVLVLVDRSKREVREDAIYAISIGEDVRLKRIKRNFDGSLALISDNKALYPEERLAPVDAEQLKVHGRVFWTERVL